MNRANVIQVGLSLLSLGGVAYFFFLYIGFEGPKAGIASESILIAIVILWTLSYLIRVFTGNMTFDEQRKRYLKEYEDLSTVELKSMFESLSKEEQEKLLSELQDDP